ncbi:MAG: MFS transporter [Nostocoides sp.]
MSPMFASLSVRNYRWWAAGALVSNVGTWMARVAQDWLVLTVLTNHSSIALGTVTALQFAPFLLAPLGGVIADRFNQRHILMVTQALLGLNSLILGLMVVTGTAQLWHVYALALAQGLTTAVDNPARQVFVSEVVPEEQLANAVALNSASFNTGRLFGPGIAGLLIAWWGTGPVFLINAASFAAVLFALAILDTSRIRSTVASRGRGSIIEGVRYVAGRPDLQLVMFLVFILGTFGMNFQITNALMATKVFDKGPGEYGLLGSIMSIGSLAAALLTARRERPRLTVLFIALLGFVVFVGASAVAPTYAAFAILLVPVGLTALTAMTTAMTYMQTHVDAQVRGRVMALYMMIFMGGTPIGAPIIGWIGDVFGPRWTLGIGAVVVGLTVVGVVAWLGLRKNMRMSFDRERTPHWVATVPSARDTAAWAAGALSGEAVTHGAIADAAGAEPVKTSGQAR